MHEQRIADRQYKRRGECYLEIGNEIHTISAHERMHPDSPQMHQDSHALDLRMKTAGYKPKTDHLSPRSTDAVDPLKHQRCGHSERLTTLRHVPEGETIRFVKNLRVCVDCHEATKFLSKMLNREFHIRDANRWHFSQDGKCSCRDYF